MTRTLIALAAFLCLAGAAEAAPRLHEYEAKNETLKVASRDAVKLRESTGYGTSFNITACTRKTSARYVCRYTAELMTKPFYELVKTCERKVTVTKQANGQLRTKLRKLPCVAATSR